MHSLNSKSQSRWRRDLPVILGFACLALIAWFGRTKGWRVDVLSSDAAAYAAAVAAQLDPGRFSGDLVLSRPESLVLSKTLLTDYLKLAAAPLGGLGNAVAALVVPTVFLQLTGFYFLGRNVLKKTWLAAAFALVTLIYIRIGIPGEHWGLYQDVLTRSMYQALYPWLLLLALQEHPAYRLRIATMLSAAALVYVHPHSAVTQAFAILCGYLLVKGPEQSWARHIGAHFALGLAFLFAVTPYIVFYIHNSSFGAALPDSTLAREISLVRVKDYNFPQRLVIDFVEVCWPFIMVILGGAIWLWRRRPDLHRLIRFVVGWSEGMFLIAAVVPVADHAAAAWLNRMPLEYDLVRSLRYVVPVGWLFVFLLGMEAAKDWPSTARRKQIAMAAFFSLFALGLILIPPRIPEPLGQAARCLVRAAFPCPQSAKERDMRQLIDTAANLPPGSRVFAETTDLGLQIRHAARQPVVYTEKEGGWFLYSKDYAGMVEWYRRYNAFAALAAYRDGDGLSDAEGWYETLSRLAREFGAEYAVIGRDAGGIAPLRGQPILLSTPTASLFKLPEE